MDPPLPPHTTVDLPGSNREAHIRHARPRLPTAGGSLQNVPEKDVLGPLLHVSVQCVQTWMPFEPDPMGTFHWPSITLSGPSRGLISACALIRQRHSPECLRDVRGISLRRVASPRGGVCDFELMDRSWSARAEEPTLWHTYLEAQCHQVCAAERAVLGFHLLKLFLCVVGGLPSLSPVMCGAKGGSIGRKNSAILMAEYVRIHSTQPLATIPLNGQCLA